MKKTVLYDRHLSLGARMGPFGGFIMPIQYEGIVKEHFSARRAVAVFDTCHMGEFALFGPSAQADLDRLFTCSVATLGIGRCRNGFLCNEQGGVMDDLIVYRLGQDRFLVVVNAATQDSDFEWIRSHLSPDTEISNHSDRTAKVDLQGPGAPALLQSLITGDISDLRFYHHRNLSYRGEKLLVSRTGYTGEIGFELYCNLEIAGDLWDDLIAHGARPAGLGARDTLRLEMCFPLYGHELGPRRNAAESGYTKQIARDKKFTGSDVVLDPARIRQLLVALSVDGRRSARSNDEIFDRSGRAIGAVTSGSFSPCLEQAVALGYVDREFSTPGTNLVIRTARQDLPCRVVEKPFYKEGTSRKPISEFLERHQAPGTMVSALGK